MAMVAFTIAGRRYELACRDGEEPRLQLLANMVDAKAAEAGRAVGEASEPRQLLLAALLLADDLAELRDANPADTEAAAAATADALAEQLEILAQRLENGPHRA